MTAFLVLVALFPLASSAKESVAKPAACSPGEHWVRAFHRRAYIRRDGTTVRDADVPAHCRTSPKGYAFWEPKLKAGLPSDWPLKESPKIWTVDERERIVEALSEIPLALWGERVTGIHRARKSVVPENPASSKDGVVVVYDNAFGEKDRLSRLLAHELAHQKYREMSEPNKRAYENATGWIELHPPGSIESVLFNRGTGFVESDGKLSPAEDFANNVEYYLFEPKKLLETTPNAHRWIRDFFGVTFKVDKGGQDGH